MRDKPPRDRSRDARPQMERAPPAVVESVTFTKAITTEDVRRFARLPGETNRLHLDEAFAARTQFEGRIIPERLLAGLITTAISRLPKLPISLSQQLEFLVPARPGETLRTVCEIVEDIGSERVSTTRPTSG